jgi:hypothetical protein
MAVTDAAAAKELSRFPQWRSSAQKKAPPINGFAPDCCGAKPGVTSPLH